MKIPVNIEKVLDTLQNAGFEAYLVGGCVRDMLLHQTPHDYDIATNALPQQVMELFDHTVPVGIKHGTILVLEDGEPVEVTTFRKEGEYEDLRHPSSVQFVKTIEEDLKRRDFTINAMAWNKKRGLVDPYGGREDLENRILKTVGKPEERFSEDALRLMRAHRFAGRYHMQFDLQTEKALHENAALLKEIAPERIREELEKILLESPQQLEQMTDLLKPWIPELEIMLQTAQNSPYHYTDVLHHTIDALRYLPVKDPVSAWALLLHDTGKPAVKTTDARGDHFKRHELASEKIARRVVKDLKLPKKAAADITALVKDHDVFYAPRLKNLYKLLVDKGWSDERIQKWFAVQEGDIKAHTTHDRMKDLNAFRDLYEKEKDQHPFRLADLPVNGEDVLAHTSLKGEQVGELLKQLQKDAIENPQWNEREILLERMRKYASKPGHFKSEQKQTKPSSKSRKQQEI
jgi:tRNA nucleotidyltransferase (CCA-adding enzyme)